MPRLHVIYQDDLITVTEDFVRTRAMRDQVIVMGEVRRAWVHKYKNDDHKAGSPMFAVAGLIFLFVFPPVGVWLLAMAVGAWLTSKFEYSLVLDLAPDSKVWDRIILTSAKARRLNRIAAVINRETLKRWRAQNAVIHA